MKPLVVLQARTSSVRLPGKVLLPVNGLPLVILAAKRAANRGHDVIIATSNEASDDALAGLISQHGFRCFRGSLHDTLDRMVSALDGIDDDALVFRLTADNVFPDGSLLDEIERDFVTRNLEYLCCNGRESGFPYGVSAELTRLCHLREAAVTSRDMHDREHVTPFVRRRFGDTYFGRFNTGRSANLRCTVDCLEDYLVIEEVFRGVPDAVNTPLLVLIERLQQLSDRAFLPAIAPKLVLGTAQLGMRYGVANQTGQPAAEMAEGLIKLAVAKGAGYLDTARSYGSSEKLIGNALAGGLQQRTKVITKLSPLNNCPEDASQMVVDSFVDASIYESCSKLRLQSLDVVLLHRAAHLSHWQGRVWRRLLEHQSYGTIRELGVSVQSPAELKFALDVPEASFLQMPFNILDWRWDEMIPSILEEKARRPLKIHVRSALLQGLLPSTDHAIWHKIGVFKPENVISWLSRQQRSTKAESVAQFCLAYVSSLDWVDGVVVGVETQEQLEMNVIALSGSGLTPQELSAISADRPALPEQVLNPACWRNDT